MIRAWMASQISEGMWVLPRWPQRDSVSEQHCSAQPVKQSGPKLALLGPKSSKYSAESQAFPNWSRTNDVKQYQQRLKLAETQTCLAPGLSQDAAQAPCLLSLVGVGMKAYLVKSLPHVLVSFMFL